MSGEPAKEIEIRGERVRLLAEGLLHWPSQSVLAVADFHLGKAETFGQAGLPLPGEAQLEDARRLRQVAERLGVETLLFLGDLVHTRKGVDAELARGFVDQLSAAGRKLILTAGNHDRGLIRQWPKEWATIEVVTGWERGPFTFTHEAPRVSDRYAWTGHLHPCVILSRGPDRLRLRTFVIGKAHAILPAFSSLAGGYDVVPKAGITLYPIAEGEVFELSQRDPT